MFTKETIIEMKNEMSEEEFLNCFLEQMNQNFELRQEIADLTNFSNRTIENLRVSKEKIHQQSKKRLRVIKHLNNILREIW